MKNRMIFALIGVLAVLLFLCTGIAEPAEKEDQAQWTVMIYLCGSDLESRYGYATGNLEEIAKVHEPKNHTSEQIGKDVESVISNWELPGKVNVLVETGGSSAWHAQALGMDIRTDRLQDWQYQPGTEEETGTFQMIREKPLANMAAPETLADFIRWGSESCPAEKYVLVLWDHGGGSKTGILIDELFSNDYMTLGELGSAFSDGGVHFEAVLFDACMMANIETAYAIRNYASWMIASQENVPAKGTAIGDWLQELMYATHCDGRLLGRWICDMTQIKYANDLDEQAQALMTWSVINLAEIDRLAGNFDTFFDKVSTFYVRYPMLLSSFVRSAFHSEQFGSGNENMMDLAGMLYSQSLRNTADVNMQGELQDALADTVDYCLKGHGRAAARGLSFCYAANFTPAELDIYALNCPSAKYLAFLDAISPWTAPDWVYEKTERLPEYSEMEAYRISITRRVNEDGTPAFSVQDESRMIGLVSYNVYRKDPATGQTISLGLIPAFLDTKTDPQGIYRCHNTGLWPSVDGALCHMEMLTIPMNGVYDILFNIPVMVDAHRWNVRCGYRMATDDFEVYGLWEGFDADSHMFNRNVRPLSQMTGQEYNLLYPVNAEDGTNMGYEHSETMTFGRGMTVEKTLLPAGEYEIEFVIYDIFIRPIRLERIRMNWDGTAMQMVDSEWEGTETLDVSRYYQNRETNYSVKDAEEP